MTTVIDTCQFIPDCHFLDDINIFRLLRFADAQILAQRTDIPTDNGKGSQNKGQHDPLEIFNIKIYTCRTVEFEQGDIAPVCQQGKNTD